ncbi:hypothetical protein J5N97_001199 [Dioscorea zingiberensis]|uniref:Uncharacterized protein n=1 Tax=Dioscorea zingiberensis TaxID=325984 RepID=A0A9D5H2J1_9LILI|nr:hypothetical protein J5N97_001199 [Dioscorea zingiberensis]
MERRKKSSFFFLPSTIILFLLIFFDVHGQTLPIVDEKQVHTYIVHVLRSEGSDEFLGDEDRETWHKSFLPNTTLDSGEPRLIYSYREVISGFAARLTSAEVRDMESMEGFLYAEQDKELSLRTTYTPSFIGLSQTDGLWVDSFKGQGVIIGVIDSGIAPGHASFLESTVDEPMPPPPKKWKGKCEVTRYCNNKVIGAVSFQGGKIGPPSPDYKGHGSHCAGIAAGSMVPDADVRGMAKGTASGVAPRAHLAIYQLCTGASCTLSDTLKAMDQAIDDGVDVLSISLGDLAMPFYKDSLAIGAFSAVSKGLVVCLPAGNSGPDISSIENDAPWAMTVGASSHDRRVKATMKLGDGTKLEGQTGYELSTLNSSLPIVFPGFPGQNGTEGCKKDSFDNIDVKGKIVVCYIRGGTFVDMGVNVKAAGGKAMIIANSFRQGITTFSDVHVLPTAHVNDSSLEKLWKYKKSNPNPTATITFDGTTYFGARPSPTIASFSSRGPSLINGGILKPDIVGPGVSILSASPVKPGPGPKAPPGSYFNFDSGTSMATPHLAGVAALLKSTHKNWSAAAIKSAIMTTAHRLDLDLKPIRDDYDSRDPANLFALGAGQVNPQAANDPGLVYDIIPFNYIQYLCGLGYSNDNVSAIARRQVRCDKINKIMPEDLNYPSISVTLAPQTKKTISRELTNVVDGGTELYLAVVQEPNGISVVVSPNTLIFSKLDEKKKFTVEFKVTGIPLSKGESAEGQLLWTSGKHKVWSPISVTFA